MSPNPRPEGVLVGQSQSKPPDVTPFLPSRLATPSWPLALDFSIHAFSPFSFLPLPCTITNMCSPLLPQHKHKHERSTNWYEPPSATLTYCTVGNGTHTSSQPFPDAAAAVPWACCPVPGGQKQDRALVDDVHNLVHRLSHLLLTLHSCVACAAH